MNRPKSARPATDLVNEPRRYSAGEQDREAKANLKSNHEAPRRLIGSPTKGVKPNLMPKSHGGRRLRKWLDVVRRFDQLFFEQNPDRKYFIRPAHWAELTETALGTGRQQRLFGRGWHVIVERHTGLRYIVELLGA